MTVGGFLLRYLRRHVAWAVLGIAGSLVFAAGTVGLVSLLKPIFSEVLLSDTLPTEVAGLATGSEAADGSGGATIFDRKADLTQHLESSYRSLKRRWGIGPDETVWFAGDGWWLSTGPA